MYKGDWPKDNSNEVLVNYYLADAIKRVKHLDSVDDVVQLPIDYLDFHFVVSGIYIPFEANDVQSANILEAYDGTSSTNLGMCTYDFKNDNNRQMFNNIKVIIWVFLVNMIIMIVCTGVIFVLENNYIETLKFYRYLNKLIIIQIVIYVVEIIFLFIYYFNTPS